MRLTKRDLYPLPPVGQTVVAGFESTYLPGYGRDSFDTTGHARHRLTDLDAVVAHGVRHIRYPLRWHRIEPEAGRFDWTETDQVMDQLRERGMVAIVDLVHHTSYPGWLEDGFRDRRFAASYVRYAEAVANRYPWLPAYTLFNEPFATLHLAGWEALWPPYEQGMAGWLRLVKSVLPAITEAAQCWSELLPDAHHVWVDTAEQHQGSMDSPGAQAYAELANDRRHVLLDLFLGHDLDPERPFLRELIEAGGEELLHLPPSRVDLLGLDYYSHSEWYYDELGGRAPSPQPAGFAAIAEHYAGRYGLPVMLTETNLRGQASDQVSWLRHTLEQYELALSRGVPLHGYCWFPQVDSCDWDSLLARGAGRRDPVGVLQLAADGSRRSTIFTEAWSAVVAGAPAAELPAYRFQAPCDRQLAGYLPMMADWPWQQPPAGEQVDPITVNLPAPVGQPSLPVGRPDAGQPTARVRAAAAGERSGSAERPDGADLVVLSHLRWPWVWQRPQQLISRLAPARAEAGGRTWFVEEPMAGDVSAPELRTEQVDGLTRVYLVVPEDAELDGHLGFDAPGTSAYGSMLADLLATGGRRCPPDVWLFTPMAFDIAQQLGARRLIYDVMDDLASFAEAPQGLVLRQRRLVAQAAVVFTGGRSLHRSVCAQRKHNVHLFPSGVDTVHYASSRALRRPHERRVAGYVGVIDERLDLKLIEELADKLPDWTIRMVGPVAKIEESMLPRRANLEYAGMTPYAELPQVMAGFDVALMPFALNEATRSISPTKTLEYLAAGLPVVSTRVADVVSDYGNVVHLADDGAEFAAACQEVVCHWLAQRDRLVRPLEQKLEWDYIAAEMSRLLEQNLRVLPVANREDVTA
jgi:beta-glucosidase/6-phospho-beta-glucosidase/beta-galactosidase